MDGKKKWRETLRGHRTEIAGLALIVFVFYYTLVHAGVATHDELMNLYQVRTGSFFRDLNWGRWTMTLMSAVPGYLHGLAESQWVYRLFTVGGLLIACAGFALLVRELTDAKTAWLTALLFFMFAQIELDHDGLISFAFSYQFNTVYVFIGLLLYWRWLRERKRKQLVFSAVFYLLGCMAYEAFVSYGLLFFLLSLFYRIGMKEVKISGLIRDIWLHAAIAAAYLALYFFLRNATGFVNADTAVGQNITAAEVATAEWKLTIGLFPLNYMPMGVRAMAEACLQPDRMNLIRWVISVLLARVVYSLVQGTEKIGWKKYLAGTVLCFAGALLPGAPAALTNQVINWLCYLGIKSYAVSYYAYFFLVAWIALTIVFIWHLCRKNRAVLAVCCAGVCLVTQVTLTGNQIYADNLNEQQDKYDLFCRLVETDWFADAEENAQLYAPDYIGIHYDIGTLAGYANARTNKNFTSTNDRGALDFRRPVYQIRADMERDVILAGKIDEAGLTNEIFMTGLEELSGLGLLASRSGGFTLLSVDDRVQNGYGSTVVTGDLGLTGRSAVIRCDGIRMDTAEVYAASGSFHSGAIVTEGIYGQEEWGRWAAGDCAVRITTDTDTEALLLLRMVMPGQEEAALTVTAGDTETAYTVQGYAGLEIPLALRAGENTIRIHSDAPDMEAPGDLRSLNFQIVGMDLVTGDTVTDLMNLP